MIGEDAKKVDVAFACEDANAFWTAAKARK
jgi:hypothetical protein